LSDWDEVVQLLKQEFLPPDFDELLWDQRGARFFGATTNFRLSFIFIEAQSLFSIGAKGVGKGLLKVEFFDCVLMRSGNLAANSLFE
jgi:hypothetical protein